MCVQPIIELSVPAKYCECPYVVQYKPLFNKKFTPNESQVWMDPQTFLMDSNIFFTILSTQTHCKKLVWIEIRYPVKLHLQVVKLSKWDTFLCEE